jgi:hypothetical protein
MTVLIDSQNGAQRCTTLESLTVALPLSAYVVRTRSTTVLSDRFAPNSSDMQRAGREMRRAIADVAEHDREQRRRARFV